MEFILFVCYSCSGETNMNTKTNTSNNDKVQKILFWAMIVLSVTFVAGLIIYVIRSWGHMFSDFAETLSYCIVKNPYTGEYGNPAIHSIYPPFAFLPFYLFALICKPALVSYINGEMTLAQLSMNASFIISFLLFYLICMAIVMLIVAKLSKFKGRKLVYLLVCTFCFAPFAYCLFRGNNIIFACILVMLFFLFYNSEKRWQREIANLCLAGAVAVKIYPALLLLFFVKDRRFLDLLKTLIYAGILIFIPFLLIEGGFKNIKEIWANFSRFNTGEGRDAAWSNIGFDGLASKIATLLHLPILHSILSKLLRFGSIIVTLVALILSKNTKYKMQPILITLLTYALFQGVSYAYTLSFLIIPVTLYFVEFESMSKLNKYYYGICYSLVALPLLAGFSFFLVAQLSAVCLLVKGYIDLYSEFVNNSKDKKKQNVEQTEPETQKEITA